MNKQQMWLRGLRIFGLIIFAFGGYLTYELSNFIKESETARATVDSVELSDSSNALYVHFKDQLDRRHFVKLDYGKQTPPFEKGEEFIVHYPIDAPDNARIQSFLATWQGTIFGGLGLIIFIGGSLPLFIERRRQNRAKKVS